MTTQLIQKVAVIAALDQNGHQVAPGEIITFDPSLSRDPEAFVKALNKSKAFRDIGKGKSRPVQPDIFPSISGGPSHTATPPVVPPADGETGGVPVEEGTQRATTFSASAVVDGNVQTASARIRELTTVEQLDAVIEAEKARDGDTRTGILEAVEARRAALDSGD